MRTARFALLVLVACGDPTSPGVSTGPGVTGVSASTSVGSTSGASSSTGAVDDSAGGGTADGSSAGLVHDVGTALDFGSQQPLGCQGKVDLLFLISRNSTMITEQDQLLASFPGFVATIQDKLADFDVHAMVINPDAYWPGWTCEKLCQMDPPPCDDDGYKCNDFGYLISPCDETLGAGLIFNAGGKAANRQCDLYGGNRYIVSGEPDMADAIECIAKVGISGDSAKGDALVAALAPEINAEGGCNAGFLRDDALLVITIISDTYDQESSTGPYQWYDAILAAKKDENAVIMLGVVPQPHVEGEPDIPMGCTYDDTPGGYLRFLIDMFPHHAYGNTCSPSYAPFFDEAAGMIAEVCADFMPQ